MVDSKYWPSPAKLNLFLYITGRREDGYHNLQTLFQFIDYCDYLYFEPRDDQQICLETELVGVKPSDNLIIKAAKLLVNYVKAEQPEFTIPHGFTISIDKKLPMGGGLGGGSSNAATTLVALNHLWQLNLSTAQLMSIGKLIGADVPIFIFGHSAFAEGIGDDVVAIDVAEKWYLIIKPEVNIATATIFTTPTLKRDAVTRNINELLHSPFTNDCEDTVRQLYPQIDHLINQLASHAPTRLTGTGSCIFCECDNKQQAEQLQLWVAKQLCSTEKITHFIAQGINQSPLMQKIIAN